MAPAEPENDAAGTSRSLTWRLRRIALVAFDAGCWVFALFAATLLRYELDLHQVEPGNVALIAGFAVVGVLVVGTALQVYRGRHCIGTVGDAIRVSATSAVLGAGLFVPNLLLATPLVPRTAPLVATLIALVLTVGARLLVQLRRERSSRTDRHTFRRVIIYGAGTDGQQLVRSRLSDPGGGYLPVALLDDNPDRRRRRVSGVDVRGTHADLAAVVAATRADLLVMAERGMLDRDESALHATQPSIYGTALLDSPDVILADIRDAETAMEDDRAADSAVACLRPLRTRQRGKRTMDLLLCVLALPLVLSVCLLIALVLVVGQGEVLYRAQRVGRNGQPFTMLKFATMRPGDAGPRVTRERDPRITPIGRWLRATKLNELPQVFNVIKGDMSIVGPRPEDPRYVAFFTPEQSDVLQVRPGLTSPAYLVFGDEQTFIESADPADIEAYYVCELLPEKLRIELQYLQAWSIVGDLRIIARTAARLINGSGGSHG
jgi:lipopolysaccharide/colanic/teichoic acid biosynthesis glycosyltransferase